MDVVGLAGSTHNFLRLRLSYRTYFSLPVIIWCKQSFCLNQLSKDSVMSYRRILFCSVNLCDTHFASKSFPFDAKDQKWLSGWLPAVLQVLFEFVLRFGLMIPAYVRSKRDSLFRTWLIFQIKISAAKFLFQFLHVAWLTALESGRNFNFDYGQFRPKIAISVRFLFWPKLKKSLCDVVKTEQIITSTGTGAAIAATPCAIPFFLLIFICLVSNMPCFCEYNPPEIY